LSEYRLVIVIATELTKHAQFGTWQFAFHDQTTNLSDTSAYTYGLHIADPLLDIFPMKWH
jgi:hypothetical protein